MNLLVVLFLAAGLSISPVSEQDSIVQLSDSMNVEALTRQADTVLTNQLVQTDEGLNSTIPQSTIIPVKSSRDSLKRGIHSPGDVKKSTMTVKNNSEVLMPDVPDLNPLLTQILLYDPDQHRVYPREPRVIEPEDALGFLKADALFRPLVFGATPIDLRLRKENQLDTSTVLYSAYTDSMMKDWKYQDLAAKASRRFMAAMEVNQLRYVRYHIKQLPLPEQLVFILQQEKPLTIEHALNYSFGKEDKKTGYLPGLTYNPWTTKGNYKLHFTETYVSPNWSRGGESNMAGLASIYLEANYNNLKGVQFDNNIELKIGLNTSPSDTLRALNVSTDQLRAVSKLGIRMKNNWYYSLSSEFTTQVLNNYKKNTMSLKSSFLSPARLFVSLGVDYKKSNNKKGYNLSVMLSPLTYKLNYLHDNVNMNTASYGIEAGKHVGSEIGSKVSSTLNWRFSERLNWKSKIYYFTDYTYVDSEWENTMDIMLNHYFSTQIFVHLKLDDRLQRQTGESLLQLQQLLSFGMTYYF